MNTPLSLLFDKAVRSAHPIYASIELTYACSLACRYCYNPVERKNQRRKTSAPARSEEPLSYGEIVEVLDQLREMNVLYLTLTGGEPLLHPRFWEIAKAAKERSFALRIFSNGVLIDEFTADRIAKLCPNCMELSIHGAKPSTAEALTQVKGAFDKQMRALELLKERGVRVYLKCVVTSLVEGELDGIQAIGDRLGFPVYFDPVLTISDDGEDYPLDFLASDETLRKLYSDPAFEAGVSPLTFNFNTLTVGVNAKKFGPQPRVILRPKVPYFQVINKAKVTTKGRNSLECTIQDASQGEQVWVRGSLGKGQSQSFFRAVHHPAQFAAHLLKQQLQALGVEITGKVREGTAPQLAEVLALHRSPPLAQII